MRTLAFAFMHGGGGSLPRALKNDQTAVKQNNLWPGEKKGAKMMVAAAGITFTKQPIAG